MPCKIEIKEKLTNKVSNATDAGFNRNLKDAQAIAKTVNDSYGVPVVKFFQTSSDFIDRDITIPEELIDRYYTHELRLEKAVSIDKTPIDKLTTLDELENSKSFQNTVVDFVAEIPTEREVPVAFRNVNKGEKFLFVKDLFTQKFKDKAWTSPAVLSDGSQATALLPDEFKTLDEFLTFALLHEKAHEYIFKNSKEFVGQYEDRINQEALRRMSNIRQQPGGQLTLFQLEGNTVSSTASPKTIAIVNDFLKRIGVNVQGVKQIVVNGVKFDANAVANLTQSLVQVVEGKEATALPEEAMHFAVSIIKQTNPALYKKLMGEINKYKLLKDVFAEYSTNPNYLEKDGKPNVIKLKEEAIAKVLTEVIINQSEGSTEKPELLESVQSWWKQIL